MFVKQFLCNQSAKKIIHHDPGSDSRVQRFSPSAHREAQMMRSLRTDGFRYPVSFVSDDQDKGRGNVFPLKEWRAVQLGGDYGKTFPAVFGKRRGKVAGETEMHPEYASHRRTEHFRRKKIRAFGSEQNAIHSCGIRCPDYCSDIAGILNSVQSDQPGTEDRRYTLRKHGSDALGRTRICHNRKNMLGESEDRNSIRNRENRLAAFPEQYGENLKIG